MAKSLRIKTVQPMIERGVLVIKTVPTGNFFYKEDAIKKIESLKRENEVLREILYKKHQEIELLKNKEKENENRYNPTEGNSSIQI